jgi:hypothetical protein
MAAVTRRPPVPRCRRCCRQGRRPQARLLAASAAAAAAGAAAGAGEGALSQVWFTQLHTESADLLASSRRLGVGRARACQGVGVHAARGMVGWLSMCACVSWWALSTTCSPQQHAVMKTQAGEDSRHRSSRRQGPREGTPAKTRLPAAHQGVWRGEQTRRCCC